jgi:xanthine dehydrogenase/oxidase
VFISETGTNTVANASSSAASATADLNGMAILNACEQIHARLAPYKVSNPTGSFESWVNAAYFDRVNLSANGFYQVSSRVLLTFPFRTFINTDP